MKKIIKVNMKVSRYALNTVDAATYLGVSEALMRKMRSEGNGPNFCKIGAKCVYPIPELKRFLQSSMVRYEKTTKVS